jgi:hypothetical protein
MHPQDVPHGGGMLRPVVRLGVFYPSSVGNRFVGFPSIIHVCPMSYPQLLGITQNAK